MVKPRGKEANKGLFLFPAVRKTHAKKMTPMRKFCTYAKKGTRHSSVDYLFVRLAIRLRKMEALIRRPATTTPSYTLLSSAISLSLTECCKTSASIRLSTTTAQSELLLGTATSLSSNDFCKTSASIRRPHTTKQRMTLAEPIYTEFADLDEEE
jgi:hypothetical protein